MGVHATFCQLCGLPVQHDHYVPSRSGGLNIYRASMANGGHDWSAEPQQPFPFTSAHAWLRDAVGLRRFDGDGVVRGPVEDGGLGDVYVGDGNEDALVFHHFCWELMGQPTDANVALRGAGQLGFEQLYSYQEQLFDFHRYAANGKSEWLLDPTTNARSRARIERILDNARRVTWVDAPSTIADVLKADRDWRGTAARSSDGAVLHHVSFRTAPRESMDRAAWPQLLCFIKNYGESGFPPGDGFMSLEELVVQSKDALEHDGFGITVLTSIGEGKLQLLAYVKELGEAHRRVDALDWARVPGVNEYDDANDPAWNVFFNEMGLPKRS